MSDTKVSAITAASDLVSAVLVGETSGVSKSYPISLFDTRYAQLATTNTFANPQTIQFTDGGTTLTALTLDIEGGNVITQMTRYISSTGGPVVVGRKTRGTRSAPTAVVSGDLLYGFRGLGYDGSAFAGALQGSALLFRAAENWNGTSYGTEMAFQVTKNTTTTLVEVMLLRNDGMLSMSAGSIGRGAPVTKTADFTVATTENWLINNKAAATCTVTLPTASSCTGREIMIKNLQAFTVVSASSNVVPLAGGAAGTAILAATAGKWATLVSDGTNWIIMAGA